MHVPFPISHSPQHSWWGLVLDKTAVCVTSRSAFSREMWFIILHRVICQESPHPFASMNSQGLNLLTKISLDSYYYIFLSATKLSFLFNSENDSMQGHSLCRTCFGQYHAGLMSCTGVTERWGHLSHAQNAIWWLALSKRSAKAPWKRSLFIQLSFIRRY